MIVGDRIMEVAVRAGHLSIVKDSEEEASGASRKRGERKMLRMFLICTVAGLVASPAMGQQVVTYGWEDGTGTVLELYGTGDPPIIATNVGAPDPVYSGSYSLRLEDNSPSGTPQAYVAWITGLNEGDIVDVSFWRYDDTPDASPSCRIWGHWNNDPCDINGYDGSASGNSDYGPGEGWDLATYMWTVPAGVSGVVVECRTYSNPGDVVWIDDITVTCPDHALVFVPDRQPLPYDLYITDAYAVCDGETTTVYYDLVLGICGPPDRGDWAEVILEAAIDFFMNDWYMGWGVQLARYVWEGSCPGQDYSDCGPGWCPAEVGFYCWYTGDDVYVIPACRPRSDAYVCHCLVTVESNCPFVYVGPWPLREGKSDVLRIVVDPNNNLAEWNEDNNEFVIAMGPTGSERPSWSSIKAMYR